MNDANRSHFKANGARETLLDAFGAGPHTLVARSTSGGLGEVASESPSVDSIGDNTSTTGVLAPGSSETDYLQTSEDKDWFKVTLTAGQTYDFTMDSPEGADLSYESHIILYNAAGSAVAQGIEGAYGASSVLTFTAATSGTYFISAQTTAGATSNGVYTMAVSQAYTPTADKNDNSIATTSTISLGQTVYGILDTPGDRDWYAVNLQAGQGYAFDLVKQGDGTFGDPILYLYGANGQQLMVDDDGGSNHNSHMVFSPGTSGTYYISAGAFADGQHGSYALSVTSAPVPLLTDSVDWGTKLNVAGGVVKVYFAKPAETYDNQISLGWTFYEIQQAMAALSVYSNYIPLTFVQTTNPDEANFKLLTVASLGASVLAYMNPPGEQNAGVGVFARNGSSWTKSQSATMEPGGLGFDTLVHEFGHGLGLAHPFDNGGSSTVMMGVTDTYDYQGLGYQNQGAYTIMAYNDGWPGGPVPRWTSYQHGFGATPMAIDIAALQAKYGANTSYHTGNDTYYLDASLPQTSYMSIWDAGGNDTLSAEHVSAGTAALVDLRQADMGYGTAAGYVFDPTLEAVSGGAVSYVSGIGGGITIAANAQIENANGHAGSDTIVGNSLNNTLRGLGGSDSIYARGGDDQIFLSMALDTSDVDMVDGGAGNDTLTLDFAHSAITGTFDGTTVSLTYAGHGTLTITNVETVIFTDGSYTLARIISVPPALTGKLSANLSGGSQHVLTTSDIYFTDLNDTSTTFYVQAADKLGTADFTGATVHGYVTVNGVQANTFTSAQLSAGQVAFVQDGTIDAPAGFSVAAFDGVSYSAPGTFSFSVIYDHGDHLFLAGTTGSDTVDSASAGSNLPLILGGFTGDDTYIISAANVTVQEQANEGNDVVRSSVNYTVDANIERAELTGSGNLTLTGNAGNNLMFGNLGNNVLDGGAGDDIMVGGAGDDTYYVDSVGDQATDSYGVISYLADPGGNDTVYASVSTSLGYWIENLILTGTAANGTGNDIANTLTGNASANTLDGFNGEDKLYGLAGDDVLKGGVGNDYLEGGLGSDTYQYSLYGGYDEINNAHAGDDPAAVDRIVFDNTITPGSITVARDTEGNLFLWTSVDEAVRVDNFFNGAEFEIQQVVFSDGTTWTTEQLKSMAIVDGGAGDDILTGSPNAENLHGRGGNDFVTGGGGNDKLAGNAGDDILLGEAGDDTLSGDDGNDTLYGGTGNDTMAGGIGDDTYSVDSVGDTIIENANAGTDTVLAFISYSIAGTNIENIMLDGSADINATGNGFDNALTGNAGSNSLDGGAGNDTLDGGLGADTMIGGLGDDTFYVDNAGDVVTEGFNQGYDTVYASVSYSVAATYVEYLTLTGGGNINATGNGLDNGLLGNTGNNRLDGSVGADTMIGYAGDDTYVVDNANDTVIEMPGEGTDTVQSSISYTLGADVENLTLTGNGTTGTGNDLSNLLTSSSTIDTLIGGRGDDSYVINNTGDVVTELANEGTDTVQSSFSYTLGANVENLVLTGSGTTGTGNALNNVLTSSITADTLIGGLGNDTYVLNNAGDVVVEAFNGGTDTVMSSVTYSIAAVYVENLTLTGSLSISATGNGMDNILTGNSGTNILNGNVGADMMIGGAGSDYYYVDNAGDTVVENANEGTDMVYALLSYSLGANVDNITLLGSGNFDAAGNELNNFVIGNAGNNTLSAGAGADYIFAQGGNDVVDGGAGADGMYGGSGDDTYYVDNFADLCNEQSTGAGIDDGGTDIVISSANFQLSGFIENLTLTGTAVVGAGNASNNVILGNASGNYLFGLEGTDTLNGGAGGDALYGGTGADTFVFDQNSGFDVIGDFSAADGDMIDLHAYSAGVVNGAGIVLTAYAGSTYVNMGGGNVIFVANASVSDVSSHIVW